MIEHLPDHKAGSGFAIGAGDTDDAEIFSRMAVFKARKLGADNMIRDN